MGAWAWLPLLSAMVRHSCVDKASEFQGPLLQEQWGLSQESCPTSLEIPSVAASLRPHFPVWVFACPTPWLFLSAHSA